MSRYDGPSTGKHPRKDGYRVEKRSNLKIKKGGGQNEWLNKGKGVVKSTTASITPLKRRLRSLNRLLSNAAEMPADVRITHEREVQALQHEIVGLLLDKTKHEMIGRYHMVRFFERQKCERRLKQSRKTLEACEDNEAREALQRNVHIKEVDLNYTQYYPYMTVYQSLLKKEKGSDGQDKYTPNDEQEDGAKGNHVIWREVEKAMENKTLDKLKDIVEEARMDKIRLEVESMFKAPAAPAKIKQNAHGEQEEQEDEDTGAGFFE